MSNLVLIYVKSNANRFLKSSIIGKKTVNITDFKFDPDVARVSAHEPLIFLKWAWPVT